MSIGVRHSLKEFKSYSFVYYTFILRYNNISMIRFYVMPIFYIFTNYYRT